MWVQDVYPENCGKLFFHSRSQFDRGIPDSSPKEANLWFKQQTGVSRSMTSYLLVTHCCWYLRVGPALEQGEYKLRIFKDFYLKPRPDSGLELVIVFQTHSTAVGHFWARLGFCKEETAVLPHPCFRQTRNGAIPLTPGDTTLCKVTPVVLHGVVSPDLGIQPRLWVCGSRPVPKSCYPA